MSNYFCSFFGRIEDTKKTFRNQLTFTYEAARSYAQHKNKSKDSLLCALSSLVININHSVKKKLSSITKSWLNNRSRAHVTNTQDATMTKYLCAWNWTLMHFSKKCPSKNLDFWKKILLVEFCQIKQKVENGSCSRLSCVNQHV